MSSKRGSAGESRMPSPHRKPTRSASSAGLAAPPSSPAPPQETVSTSAAAFFLPTPLLSSREDCFLYSVCVRVRVFIWNAEREEVERVRERSFEKKVGNERPSRRLPPSPSPPPSRPQMMSPHSSYLGTRKANATHLSNSGLCCRLLPDSIRPRARESRARGGAKRGEGPLSHDLVVAVVG
jgi:hypothetical protein